MDSANANARLRAAGFDLSHKVDHLTKAVIEIDAESSRCAGLADRYADFAQRMEGEYPSLAGPAAKLSELFRELDLALARMNGKAEAVVRQGGTLADDVIDLTKE